MSLTNLVKPDKTIKKSSWLTPRMLSLIVGAVGLVLGVLLYFPLSKVFSGEWVLNQHSFTIKIEYIRVLIWDFPVNDILIRNYSICILGGALGGFAMALYLAKQHYIVSTLIDRLFVGLLIFGIIGARLFFVLFNLDKFEEDPLDTFLLYNGGLAIFGAVIAGAIYLWTYCKKYKFNFFELGDILAPSLLVGQIIGRFGNLFNYESYGGPTSVWWKMYVPGAARNVNNYDYEPLVARFFHPTFLYEIVLNFLLLLLILWRYERLTYKKSGMVLGLYLMGYGLIRSFTEFFRLDALKIKKDWSFGFPDFVVKGIEKITNDSYEFIPAWFEKTQFDGILVSQITALILFIIGFLVWNKRRKVTYLKRDLREYNSG